MSSPPEPVALTMFIQIMILRRVGQWFSLLSSLALVTLILVLALRVDLRPLNPNHHRHRPLRNHSCRLPHHHRYRPLHHHRHTPLHNLGHLPLRHPC